jgi:hypothetical protein
MKERLTGNRRRAKRGANAFFFGSPEDEYHEAR